MSKSNKSNSVSSFAARLSKTSGRIVGVTTTNSSGTRKFNGQVTSVGASFVTMYDRNQKKQVKFALASVESVSGV